MKFNPIEIKREDGEVLKFYPKLIEDIKIGLEQITIWQFKEQSLLQPDKHILYKKDFYWTEWSGFINQLRITFKI